LSEGLSGKSKLSKSPEAAPNNPKNKISDSGIMALYTKDPSDFKDEIKNLVNDPHEFAKNYDFNPYDYIKKLRSGSLDSLDPIRAGTAV
jgi:hypothetical protein